MRTFSIIWCEKWTSLPGSNAQTFLAYRFLKSAHAVENFRGFRVAGYAVEHVRRAHHSVDAIAGGDTRHLQSLLHGLGTVVELGKDVRMDIDHTHLRVQRNQSRMKEQIRQTSVFISD